MLLESGGDWGDEAGEVLTERAARAIHVSDGWVFRRVGETEREALARGRRSQFLLTSAVGRASQGQASG